MPVLLTRHIKHNVEPGFTRFANKLGVALLRQLATNAAERDSRVRLQAQQNMTTIATRVTRR